MRNTDYKKAVVSWTPGSGVVHVCFVDSEADKHTDLMPVSYNSVSEVCEEYDLKPAAVWAFISSASQEGAHSVFIDVVEYKKAEKRQGLNDVAYQLVERVVSHGFDHDLAVELVKEVSVDSFRRGYADGFTDGKDEKA